MHVYYRARSGKYIASARRYISIQTDKDRYRLLLLLRARKMEEREEEEVYGIGIYASRLKTFRQSMRTILAAYAIEL